MTALVALDWGSSRLRAWRLDHAGTVLDERASDDGASRLQGGAAAFDAAWLRLTDGWPAVPTIACGMVGSAHGWREAPYLDCPRALDALHEGLVRVATSRGNTVHLVPGLMQRGPAPDVMRGEETQLAGLLQAAPELAAHARVVMPGTHSKWVDLVDGRVQRFATRMTGELFALLRDHSVLARLMAPGAATDDAAFDHGVATAQAGEGADLARWLFGVRARGLFGELAPEASAEFLSGLLIGAEIASALREDAGAPLALVGEPALTQRYARALHAFGRAARSFPQPLAAGGLWQVARAAGLLR